MNLEIKHLASYLQWELKLIQKKDWHSENWEDYNKAKGKKGLWACLKRKTAEKVAKDNNINLNEEILEIGEDD